MSFLYHNLTSVGDKMKKRKFKVKKNNWFRIDCVIVLILIIALTAFVWSNATSIYGEIDFMTIIMLLFMGTISILPFIMIYLGIKVAVKSNERKNVVFEVVDNIEYYRENLGEISPAIISLMMDLDIENNKDICAMLLYCQSKKMIWFDEQKNIVINHKNNISESDEAFLNWLKTKDYTDLARWKTLVEKEAYLKGYIKDKTQNSWLSGCTFPILLGVVITGLLILIVVTTFNESTINIYETEIAKIPDYLSTLEQWKMVLGNSKLLTIICKFMLFIVLFMIDFFVPLFSFVYFITNVFSRKRFKRTKLGNQLTERIYAMKNFIHDFGNLSERTKEHLVLWDYFLIYAIVLEENEKIVEEISDYNKVNLKDFIVDKKNK